MSEQLANSGFVMPDLTPALPEIFVLTMACMILVVDLFLTDRNRVITYLMSLATLVGAAMLTFTPPYAGPVLTFSGTFVSDAHGRRAEVFRCISPPRRCSFIRASI